MDDSPAVVSLLEDRVAVVELTTPVLSARVLGHLERALADLASSATEHPVVLVSRHPSIYLAGADLGEIARLDRTTSADYAALGRLLVERLHRHPAATVAAVHGSCLGGGLDLALACDITVAGAGAVFGHPGARRGLVTGWGGTLLLATDASRSLARRALIEAGVISSPDMVAAGLARRCGKDPVETALALARRLRRLHPLRLALWRSLKGGGFVDSFRTVVVHNQM